MSFIKEFKDFVSRGNMVDLAVGVVIGTAFGKIITSLVSDIIMPMFGFLMSGINFKDYKWILRTANGTNPELAVTYGNLVQVGIEFLIISFCIFVIVKLINKIRPKPPKPDAKPAEEILLLSEIRDLLKKRA